MPHILTLVASDRPLTDAHVNQAAGMVRPSGPFIWLEEGKAIDIPLAARPEKGELATLRENLASGRIDVFITTQENRRKKLLIADMDSTIITGETLDELAAHAGLKDKIAAITARAMNGEMDFKVALRERVALLEGLSEAALAETLAATRPSPGAVILVATMKKNGASCVLVSGGFSFFTGAIAERLGFDRHHGNALEIEDGKLAGTVGEPILDKDAKLAFLYQYCAELNLAPEDCLALGDGANDLPMLKAAGLGIGYCPKPAVAAELENFILHGDLTAALYAQGFANTDFSAS